MVSLPGDMSPINKDVIDYLQVLFDSNGGTNPSNVRTIVFFFDDKDPQCYHRPGMPTAKKIPGGNINEQAKQVSRLDEVTVVVFQKNPTCFWKVINGSHRLYCG
jgi:hypothetical protein